MSVVTQDHDNSLCAFGECKQEREKEVEEVKKRKIVAGKGGWGKESPPFKFLLHWLCGTQLCLCQHSQPVSTRTRGGLCHLGSLDPCPQGRLLLPLAARPGGGDIENQSYKG